MKNTKSIKKEKMEKKYSPRIGTWLSLGMLAAVIIGTYVLMFSFYFDRV